MDQIIHEGNGSSPIKKVKTNLTALTSLRDATIVVADTGRINEMEKFKPQDATTNPSLILEAAKLPEYQQLITHAIKQAIHKYQTIKAAPPATKASRRVNSKKNKTVEEVPTPAVELPPFNFNTLSAEEQKHVIEMVTDQLSVNFGIEILKIVPGYVSTEVDARLSYDKVATQEKAKRIIELYAEAGIPKERILVKIASTWEGIQAAKALKKDGIQCNMTLIFNYYQGIACAQGGIRLISPFVGRILDWYKKAKPEGDYNGANHPGVKMVTNVWNYFKKYNHDTITMAASLRLVSEAEQLCGCDRMTIPVKLLDELSKLEGTTLERKLIADKTATMDIPKVTVDEKLFRWELNQDAMANDKLTEGIRKFAEDLDKLEDMIRAMLTSM